MATSVEAPMVGKILKIEKQVGDHVDEDEVVIVMEAMKMEIPIVAPATGTVFPGGDTVVTCTATDSAGNQAQASFTVHVEGATEQIRDLVAAIEDAAGLSQM